MILKSPCLEFKCKTTAFLIALNDDSVHLLTSIDGISALDFIRQEKRVIIDRLSVELAAGYIRDTNAIKFGGDYMSPLFGFVACKFLQSGL